MPNEKKKQLQILVLHLSILSSTSNYYCLIIFCEAGFFIHSNFQHLVTRGREEKHVFVARKVYF